MFHGMENYNATLLAFAHNNQSIEHTENLDPRSNNTIVENSIASSSSAPASVEQHATSSYRVRLSVSSNRVSRDVREETTSCIIVLVSFWFLASMTLILGFYGSERLALGPNYSRLIHANSLFVQEIDVNGDKDSGVVLYGFSHRPSLEIQKTWNRRYHSDVPAMNHQVWVIWLNKGSTINISYNVKAADNSGLVLVLSSGKTRLTQWIDNPYYPYGLLSWNDVNGTGSVQQEITEDSEYYIAAGNLDSQDAEIYLNVSVQGTIYDVANADYACTLKNNLCGLKLVLFGQSYAVLAAPDVEEQINDNQWYVKLSYGPRWTTYLVVLGSMVLIILILFKVFLRSCSRSEEITSQNERSIVERAPSDLQKDDDSSCGSSYVSIPSGDEDEDDKIYSLSPKGECSYVNFEGNNELCQYRLCAICYDAQRDSFFLPCGHCITCYECAVRINEETNCCPICRKKIRRVRKIYTV